MRKRFITRDLEVWLYENYSHMSNQELAEEFAARLKKRFSEEKRRMKCLLPSITHPRTYRELEKDIIFMEHFDDVSPDFIRKLAKKLKCPPKSSQHISDINRMKALVTRRTVWKGKAQPRPEEVMPWLRTFRIREIRYIKLHEPNEIKSWRASLSNFNRLEGFEKRIYFTSEVDRKILIMKIQANLYRAMQ